MCHGGENRCEARFEMKRQYSSYCFISILLMDSSLQKEQKKKSETGFSKDKMRRKFPAQRAGEYGTAALPSPCTSLCTGTALQMRDQPDFQRKAKRLTPSRSFQNRTPSSPTAMVHMFSTTCQIPSSKTRYSPPRFTEAELVIVVRGVKCVCPLQPSTLS